MASNPKRKWISAFFVNSKADRMSPPRPTELAQTLLRGVIREGDTVIDATAGNGHDTLFLAECVGASGWVLAFDVQAAAIDATRARIHEAGLAERVLFHQCSHTEMVDHLEPSQASAVMFNLGYLPGEDHEITTRAEETIMAIMEAAKLLKSGGSLTVVCYPGHPEGEREANEVEKHIASLTDQGWRIAKYAMLGTRRPAPFLVMACKA
jgi:predicted methyltransferase